MQEGKPSSRSGGKPKRDLRAAEYGSHGPTVSHRSPSRVYSAPGSTKSRASAMPRAAVSAKGAPNREAPLSVGRVVADIRSRYVHEMMRLDCVDSEGLTFKQRAAGVDKLLDRRLDAFESSPTFAHYIALMESLYALIQMFLPFRRQVKRKNDQAIAEFKRKTKPIVSASVKKHGSVLSQAQQMMIAAMREGRSSQEVKSLFLRRAAAAEGTDFVNVAILERQNAKLDGFVNHILNCYGHPRRGYKGEQRWFSKLLGVLEFGWDPIDRLKLKAMVAAYSNRRVEQLRTLEPKHFSKALPKAYVAAVTQLPTDELELLQYFIWNFNFSDYVHPTDGADAEQSMAEAFQQRLEHYCYHRDDQLLQTELPADEWELVKCNASKLARFWRQQDAMMAAFEPGHQKLADNAEFIALTAQAEQLAKDSRVQRFAVRLKRRLQLLDLHAARKIPFIKELQPDPGAPAQLTEAKMVNLLLDFWIDGINEADLAARAIHDLPPYSSHDTSLLMRLAQLNKCVNREPRPEHVHLGQKLFAESPSYGAFWVNAISHGIDPKTNFGRGSGQCVGWVRRFLIGMDKGHCLGVRLFDPAVNSGDPISKIELSEVERRWGDLAIDNSALEAKIVADAQAILAAKGDKGQGNVLDLILKATGLARESARRRRPLRRTDKLKPVANTLVAGAFDVERCAAIMAELKQINAKRRKRSSDAARIQRLEQELESLRPGFSAPINFLDPTNPRAYDIDALNHTASANHFITMAQAAFFQDQCFSADGQHWYGERALSNYLNGSSEAFGHLAARKRVGMIIKRIGTVLRANAKHNLALTLGFHGIDSGHALGLYRRANGSVYFFDPCHGTAAFANSKLFLNWFENCYIPAHQVHQVYFSFAIRQLVLHPEFNGQSVAQVHATVARNKSKYLANNEFSAEFFAKHPEMNREDKSRAADSKRAAYTSRVAATHHLYTCSRQSAAEVCHRVEMAARFNHMSKDARQSGVREGELRAPPERDGWHVPRPTKRG